MIIRKLTGLLRFRLSAIFVLMAVAALLFHFVVEPEVRRTNTFSALHEMNAVQPPIITMFSGGPPNYDPILEPKWFANRQLIARLLGMSPVPWHGNSRIDFLADKAMIFDLASSCEDLGLFVIREYKYAEQQARYSKNYEQHGLIFPLLSDRFP